MAKIYKITNIINDKRYIGKTSKSIESRFKEHIRESRKVRTENRPLYRAFIKHGIENFKVELIEEVDEARCAEKEIFWINFYEAYKKGYNATKGGDGKLRINREELIKVYEDSDSILDVHKKLGYATDTISIILKENNIQLKRKVSTLKIKVGYIDKENKKLVFDSLTDAALHLITLGLSKSLPTKIVSKISLSCRGLRKSAYGFQWFYLE